MNNILSKEDFIDVMKHLEKLDSYQQELNDVHSKYGADGCLFPFDGTPDIIILLETMFCDKGEWIDYYCYQLDFGHKADE
jgi:hypothetical protein